MAKKILKGKEAYDWLKAQRNDPKYRIVSGAELAKPVIEEAKKQETLENRSFYDKLEDKGGITGVVASTAKSIFNPFRKSGAGVAIGIANLLGDKQMAQTIKAQNFAPRSRNYNEAVATSSKRNIPLETALAFGQGVATLKAPTKFLPAVGTGAFLGVNTDKISKGDYVGAVSDIVGGATGAGIANQAFKYAPKLLSKISKVKNPAIVQKAGKTLQTAGDDLTDDVFGVKLSSQRDQRILGGVTSAEETVRKTKKILVQQRQLIGKTGLPSTSKETAKEIDSVLKNVIPLREAVSKKSNINVSTAEFAEFLANSPEVKNIAGLNKNTQVRTFVRDLESFGDTLNAKAVLTLRKKLDNMINYARSKETSEPLLERFATFARRNLDNVVKTDPNLAKIDDVYSTLSKIKPFVTRAASESQSIKSPLLLRGIAVPTLDIPQRAQTRIGNTLKGVGKFLEGGKKISPSAVATTNSLTNKLTKTSQSARPYSALLAQLFQNSETEQRPTITETVPNSTEAEQEVEMLGAPASTNLPQTFEEAMETAKQRLGITNPINYATALQQAIQIASNLQYQTGKKPTTSELLAIAEDLMNQSTGGVTQNQLVALAQQIMAENRPPVKTNQDRKFARAANIAEQALDLLNSGKVSTGKVYSLFGNPFGKFTGTASNDQTDYQSKLSTAATALRNALLGANMTVREIQSLVDTIPVLTDEPKIAKQKLASFIESMRFLSGDI